MARRIRLGGGRGRSAATAAVLLAASVTVVLFTATTPARADTPTCGSTGVFVATVTNPKVVQTSGSCVYNTVGSDSFTVPMSSYPTAVTFDVYGPNGYLSNDGAGGEAKGTVTVAPVTDFRNQVSYQINVGSGGGEEQGGWNGGGSAGALHGGIRSCFGGAGASDVRVAPDGLADRIFVGGGGGGVCANSDPTTNQLSDEGGDGGGLTGTAGPEVTGGGAGGGPGTQGSAGASPGAASSAGFGFGGGGADGIDFGVTQLLPGGGGGGGWYGGGGGNYNAVNPGPGGGGSGYVTPNATNTQLRTGAFQVGDRPSAVGLVIVTWSVPPDYLTNTTVTSSNNPAGNGQAVTFTASISTLDPTYPIGGGAVSFVRTDVVNGETLATVPVTPGPNGTATASWTTTDLPAGSIPIAAGYNGYHGTTYADAPSVNHVVQFVRTPQTISFTSTAPAGAQAFGATYTVAATSSAGLPVAFSVDASTSGVCAVSGSVVSFIGGGTCTIDANQPGDATFDAAPQVQQSFSVTGPLAQSITFTSTPPPNLTYLDTYTITATGGGSGNPVTFAPDHAGNCSVSSGNVVHFTFGGTCTIDANQPAGNGYAAAPTTQQLIVVQARPIVAHFTSTAPVSAPIGGTYTVTAAVDISGLQVSLSLDAASSGCTMSNLVFHPGLTPYNSADIAFTGIGTCVIDGVAKGDGQFYADSAQIQQSVPVGGQSQAVTITSTPPANPIYGGSYSVTATGGGSGNPILVGTTTPAVCTSAGAVVTFVGVGECDVTVGQAGNSLYFPAPTVTTSVTVGPAALTVHAPTVTVRYGTDLEGFAPTYSGFVGADDPSSLPTPPICTATVSSTTAVGSYPGAFSCAGAVDPDYTFSYLSGSVTITKAPLTVRASSANSTYGQAPPAITAGITGYVNGESSTALSAQPTCSTSATAASPVGDYTSTCANAAAGNYSFIYLPGTVSVGKAPLTITASSASALYGQSPPAVTASYDGFVNGDQPSALSTLPTCTTTATSASAPGTYPSSCAGAAADNYAISYVNGNVTVAKGSLTLTPSNVSYIRSLIAGKMTFTVQVVNGATHAPVKGILVTVRAVSYFGFSMTCTATTGATGVASCAISNGNIWLIRVPNTYSASVAATTTYNAASATGKITLH